MLRICENCIHNKVCNEWAVTSGIPFVNANTCENFMTADVVPRSEVEELSGKYEDLKLKYAELQKDKDELIAWVDDKKTEVAREIFEEIKICMECEYMSYLKAYDYTLLTRIEELKKKYTEK